MAYTIRQVIELTGASEFLLRGWESRYKAFSPKRSKTKRRLYSDEDVLKARALVHLTGLGMRPGKIAHLPLAKLQKLMGEPDGQDTAPSRPAHPQVQTLMAHTHKLDWRKIKGALLEQRRRLGGLDWVNRLVVPLIHEMAHQSDSGRLSIVQERLLSSAIDQSLTPAPPPKARTRSLVAFATVEGDFHDLALKIASFIASELKVETLYLGSHIPGRELCELALRTKVTHVVLTSTPSRAVSKQDFLEYIHFLDSHLPENVAVWVGGRNASAHEISLGREFKILKSFAHYQEELACLE